MPYCVPISVYNSYYLPFVILYCISLYNYSTLVSFFICVAYLRKVGKHDGVLRELSSIIFILNFLP